MFQSSFTYKCNVCTVPTLATTSYIRSAGKIVIAATKRSTIQNKNMENRYDANVSSDSRVVSRPATLNGGVDLAQHWGFT